MTIKMELSYDGKKITLEDMKLIIDEFNNNLTEDEVINYRKYFSLLEKLDKGVFLRLHEDRCVCLHSKEFSIRLHPINGRPYKSTKVNIFGSRELSDTLDVTGEHGSFHNSDELCLIYVPPEDCDLILQLNNEFIKPFFDYQEAILKLPESVRKIVLNHVEYQDELMIEYIGDYFDANVEKFPHTKIN
jgi:hypothetical protein